MDQGEDSITTNRQIKIIVHENSKPQDGSVPKDQSAWGYTVKHGVTIIHEDSAAIHSLYLDHCS